MRSISSCEAGSSTRTPAPVAEYTTAIAVGSRGPNQRPSRIEFGTLPISAMPMPTHRPMLELELPQRLRVRGDQERAAEQQQPERIDRGAARSGRTAGRPAAPSARPPARSANRPRPPAARSQPKLSEIGFRKTVKLSPRPRPSTDSAKHSASTLSAMRAGFSGFVDASPPWRVLIHAEQGARFRAAEQASKANAPMQA